MGLVADIIGIGGGLIKRARAKRKEKRAAKQSAKAEQLQQSANAIIANKLGFALPNAAQQGGRAVRFNPGFDYSKFGFDVNKNVPGLSVEDVDVDESEKKKGLVRFVPIAAGLLLLLLLLFKRK